MSSRASSWFYEPPRVASEQASRKAYQGLFRTDSVFARTLKEKVMRSLADRLGMIGTLFVILALLFGVLVVTQVQACDTAVVGGGAFSVVQQPQYVMAAPQFVVQQPQYVVAQPVVAYRQVVVQPQVQVQAVRRVYAQPQLVVQPQYAVQAQAVVVGKDRARFALRPRLQRAANIGASSAIGAPARVVR